MIRKCYHCGADFETGRANRRYCGDLCRNRAWIQRSGPKDENGDPVTDLNNPKVVAWEDMPDLSTKLLHLQKRHYAVGLVRDPDRYHAMCHGAVLEHEHSAPAVDGRDRAERPIPPDRGSEARPAPTPGPQEASTPTCNCAEIRVRCFHRLLTDAERAANWAVDLQNPDYMPDSSRVLIGENAEGEDWYKERPGQYNPRPWDFY